MYMYVCLRRMKTKPHRSKGQVESTKTWSAQLGLCCGVVWSWFGIDVPVHGNEYVHHLVDLVTANIHVHVCLRAQPRQAKPKAEPHVGNKARPS